MAGRYDMRFNVKIKDRESLDNLLALEKELVEIEMNIGPLLRRLRRRSIVRKFFVDVVMFPFREAIAFVLESMPRYVVKFDFNGKTRTSNAVPTWNPIEARNRAERYDVESGGQVHAWVERIY